MEVKSLVASLVNNDISFDTVRDKLTICAFRKKIYNELHKDISLKHAGLIRYLLCIEMEERYKDPYDDDVTFEDTYDYEAFYWCLFLLSRIGDIENTKIIWEAKHIDFDAYFGVDMQLLVGPGVDATIAFLKKQPDETSLKILEYLLECRSEGLFDDMKEWYDFRYRYYFNMICISSDLS